MFGYFLQKIAGGNVMKDNQPETLEKKKETNSSKLIIFALVSVGIFVVDLYFMINQPKNIVILVLITILLLIAVFMVLEIALSNAKQEKIELEQRYEKISKSEKASYLLLRKSYDDIVTLIQNANPEKEFNEVIKTQKAVAKLIIGRNKENSDALMNSNDNVIDKMFAIEDSVNKMQSEIIANQEGFSQKFNEEDMQHQDKLFIELNNTEASISNYLMSMSEKLSGFQEEIERLADQIAASNLHIKEVVSTTEDPFMKENFQTSSLDELNFDEELGSFTDDEMDIFPDELTLEEPEEKAAELDLSDPGKMMTPEEIEALIAGTLGGTEKVADDLTLEEPQVEEEKPAMPDLSDPGKMMTPEEIAALIANM